MTSEEATKLKKADIARDHRDRFLKMVRDGKMTADEYLHKICGVPSHRLAQARIVSGL
jgi:hypothetical protein